MTINAHSKHGSIYIEDIKALNLPKVISVARHTVDEHAVDLACEKNLVNTGFEAKSISVGNSGIKDIDKNLPSKGQGGGVGRFGLPPIM